jgi:autophagy-related protein 5
MIQLHTIINSHPISSSRHQQQRTQQQPSPSSPLRLILHLKARQPPTAPPTSSSTSATPPAVLPTLSNSVETCRIAFISLLKEADYIRWGNTRRITGLRRADLEGAWEGIVERMFLCALRPSFPSFPGILSAVFSNLRTVSHFSLKPNKINR